MSDKKGGAGKNMLKKQEPVKPTENILPDIDVSKADLAAQNLAKIRA